MSEALIAESLRLCRLAKSAVLRGDTALRDECMNALESTLQTLSSAQTSSTSAALNLQAKVLQQLREPVITLDLGGYLTGWNKGAETLFGYSPEEAIGRHILFLYADELEGDDPMDQAMPELFLDQGTSFIEVRRRKKSGEVFWAGLSLSMIRGEDNEPVGMVAHLSEITDRLSAEQKLRLHARIIEDSDQGILITDANEKIVSVNTAFTRITGYTASEALGQTTDLLRSGKHDADFREQVRAAMRGAGPWSGEIIGKRKSGDLFPQAVSISVVRDEQGHITHAFSIFSDISVLRAAEERMQRLVNYDTLTGLPNRVLLNQLVTQALVTAKRNDDHGALLVIDLNRFTAINDALGFEAGDEVLRQISQRFRLALRDEDVLARVDGDEFVIALLSIQKREHSAFVAQKLLATLESPFLIDDHALHIGACIGIAIYPEDGEDTATLLRCADVAMQRVQDNNEIGYLFFSAEMNQRAKEQLRLEHELRRALLNKDLLLFYQPKVSLRSGKIVGAEALIRWRHPVEGMIPPGKFIPVAEETGLILDIGTWVLEESCRQIRVWREAGVDVPPIAVNLSARQFDSQLPARVGDVLERNALAPDCLKLEITESLLVRGAESVIPIMNQLAGMGLGLALDDFGTGYSSLSYLKRFPITTLKIDRSFVIGVPQEENDCAIAQAIVTMGQQLRQEIVAEGVETLEQMRFLRDLGCDQLQGFLFSPPKPEAEFVAMLQQDRRLDLG